MSDQLPDVSVLIVSWNTRELTLACLASLHAAAGALHYDVWVIDNGSGDDSVQAIRERWPTVHVIAREDNVGFAAANNQGIQASRGRYVLLLNSDTEMTAGAMETLVRFADRLPRAGAVGPMLINPDGSFQWGPARFPSIASELLSVSGLGPRLFHKGYPSRGRRGSGHVQRAEYISGACILARRTAIDDVGPLDEGYFMYAEETDWCWRLHRRQWEVWYTPEASVVHHGGQSTRQVREEMIRRLYRSKVRFFRLHRGRGRALLLSTVLVAATHARRAVRWFTGRRPIGVALKVRDLVSDPSPNVP